MRRRGRRYTGIARSLLGLLAIGCATQTAPVLAKPGSAPSVKQGKQSYWVFFIDKGPIADLHFALDARKQELSAATLKRRAKVRPADALVDTRDLAVRESYAEQVQALASSEIRIQSRWLNAITLDLSPEERRAIEGLTFVDRVEVVGASKRTPIAPRQALGPIAPPPQGPPRALDYGKTKAQLERMGIPAAHDCGLTGKGVTVGVIDSGFRTSLKLFSKIEILGQYDFVKKDDNVSDQPGDASGQDGHGTSCLGLVAGSAPGEYIGAAPDVKVLLAKTEDIGSEKSIEEDYFVAGLEWVESKGADIATSSLGYSDWIKPGEKDGKTAKVSIATNTAFENGLICLTSAGNSGPKPKTLSVPADGIHVISVGATSIAGKIANFSSRGPTDDGRMKPEIVAPGEQVWVSSSSGRYSRSNGTSFSAPMAAGGVALLLQMDPKLSPQGMRDLLQKTARSKGKPDNNYGWGEMDIAKAVKEFCECVDADKDGFRDEACGGKDCDDENPNVHPDAKEVCDDEVDNDCDEKVDEDDSDCEESGGSGDSGDGSSDSSGKDPSPKTGDPSVSIEPGNTPDDAHSPDEPSPDSEESPEASPTQTTKKQDSSSQDPAKAGGCTSARPSSPWLIGLGFGLLAWRRRSVKRDQAAL